MVEYIVKKLRPGTGDIGQQEFALPSLEQKQLHNCVEEQGNTRMLEACIFVKEKNEAKRIVNKLKPKQNRKDDSSIN